MNVKEIVKEYLEKNGFDGLYSMDCSCRLDDEIDINLNVIFIVVLMIVIMIMQEDVSVKNNDRPRR